MKDDAPNNKLTIKDNRITLALKDFNFTRSPFLKKIRRNMK